MPGTANPYREDIARLLRRAECHFGHTLNEEEAGLTVAESVARRRIVVPQDKNRPGIEQVTNCREAVHRVLDGEIPGGRGEAGYDEAAYRALLHFRGEMSPELYRYVVTRLGELQSTHKIKPSVKPLRCYYPACDPTTLTASAEDQKLPHQPETIAGTEVDPSDFELGYASTEERQQVDDLAMKLALDEATRWWPESTVTRMPHNNPGYDIEVQHPAGGTRYIEVKGTRSAEPCFFITAGEVEHSRKHPDRCSIWIFHAMDLDLEIATLTEHDGPITEPHFELQPVQYRGLFTGSR